MELFLKNLTPLARTMPEYDGHSVCGLIDENGRIIIATFIHREGAGMLSQHGPLIKSGGGTRRWKYPSNAEAFVDGLRLSRGMSYKFAGLDLPIGGAKTVIFGHNIPAVMTEDIVLLDILEAFAEKLLPCVGSYLTAEDIGTTPQHMLYLSNIAPKGLVTGFERDVSQVTAHGVVIGTEIALKARFGKFVSLADPVYVIQGVGAVGGYIVDRLVAAGASHFTICDDRPDREAALLNKYPYIKVVPKDKIYDVDGDVFMPCALGGTINKETIPRLCCEIISGCSNNQLRTAENGMQLHEDGKLYAPDYINNAGGLIAVVCDSILGKPVETLLPRIAVNLQYIFAESKQRNMPTSVIADEMVRERVSQLQMPL
ncbi:MAG: hypothetical protein HYT30_02330 [Parcubacteria group bacterium]|nr:hypothetical protein [Parcubacteria group bacterium]